MMDRRTFIKLSALTTAGLCMPVVFRNPLFAATLGEPNTKEPILVVIFLRGAMDGLSFLPPVGDPDYFSLRPYIAIGSNKSTSAIKLKDGFALHPSLSEIQKIFNRGEAGFIFEAGSPAETRSHFDAQDWMEAGISSSISMDSGFLTRIAPYLHPKSEACPSSVAIQNGLPRILKGADNSLVFADFKALKLQGPLTMQKISGDSSLNPTDEKLDPALAQIYGGSEDPLFRKAAQAFIKGSSSFQKAEQLFEKEQGAIPKGALAKSLAQISTLIRSDAGTRVAVTEMGGWDTHVYQGNADQGALRDRLAEFDAAVGSFWNGLGNARDQVCLVTITEFGRTVQENGDRGTDHGHGSTFMVMNGRLKGHQVHHQFQGLAKNKLYEGRDLQVRFDYREIFKEVFEQHLKISPDMKKLFPDFNPVGSTKIGLFNPT